MKVENELGAHIPGSANVAMITMFLASLLASRELRVGGIRCVSFTVSSSRLNYSEVNKQTHGRFLALALFVSHALSIYITVLCTF